MIIKLIVALHLSVSHSFRGPEGEGRTNSGQMKQMSPDLLLDPLFHEAILQRGFNEGGVGAVTMALGTLSDKKTGLCGKNSQAADPPHPPPQFGNFHIFLPFL